MGPGQRQRQPRMRRARHASRGVSHARAQHLREEDGVDTVLLQPLLGREPAGQQQRRCGGCAPREGISARSTMISKRTNHAPERIVQLQSVDAAPLRRPDRQGDRMKHRQQQRTQRQHVDGDRQRATLQMAQSAQAHLASWYSARRARCWPMAASTRLRVVPLSAARPRTVASAVRRAGGNLRSARPPWPCWTRTRRRSCRASPCHRPRNTSQEGEATFEGQAGDSAVDPLSYKRQRSPLSRGERPTS